MDGSAAGTIAIRSLDDAAEGRWDAFVNTAPEATFFHRAGWRRVIERSFGHRTHFVYAESQGRIRGVLPLVEINSRLFGHALISNAFCVYGGPVADDETALAALNDHAVALGERLGVGHIEYRGRRRHCTTWIAKEDLYVTFRKPIAADHDANLKAIPRKQRAMVRKGIKEGLVGEIDADTTRLHRVYAESVRNLGTPVFPRRYFQALLETFAPDCDVLTVTKDGTAVAAVLNFYFRDEVLPYYGGGTAAARDIAANDFMYWELMRHAAERGARLFDFGRSKRDTGAFSFKKNWGFEPTPLPYEYRLVRATSVPDVNPLNPKYQAFIALWQRLPLAVANVIGPLIVRNLG